MVRFAREPEVFRGVGGGSWLSGAWPPYAGMVFLQVLVAVIPGEPLEIAGGYAFGAVWGTVLCLLGAFLGSVAVFAVVRKWGVPLVEVFFPKEKLNKLAFLKTSPKRTALLWLVFTVPGTPKDLLCYFAGLMDLRWPSWLLIASVGRLPSIITSTVGGNALDCRTTSSPPSPSPPRWPSPAWACSSTGRSAAAMKNRRRTGRPKKTTENTQQRPPDGGRCFSALDLSRRSGYSRRYDCNERRYAP